MEPVPESNPQENTNETLQAVLMASDTKASMASKSDGVTPMMVQFLAIKAVEPAKTPVRTACKINVTLCPVTAAAIASGPRFPTTLIATIELVA